MDTDDFMQQIKIENEKMRAASDAVDMANHLIEEVIERTEQFREGFYSTRMVRDHARQMHKTLTRLDPTEAEPEQVIAMLKENTQAFQNLYATIMSEIERLDKP